MRRSRHLAPASLVVLAVALALTGCGRAVAPLTPDPDHGAPASAHRSQASTGSVVRTPDDPGPPPGGDLLPPEISGTVNTIVDPIRGAVLGPVRFVRSLARVVKPGRETTLQTGRWTLAFHPGSLASRKVIRIARAADGSMRVQFSPDGTQFGTPVDLTADYSGTSLDPGSPTYVRGSVPCLMWLDPATSTWIELPSTYDTATRQLHAQLHHFSTYGVGSRAGW